MPCQGCTEPAMPCSALPSAALTALHCSKKPRKAALVRVLCLCEPGEHTHTKDHDLACSCSSRVLPWQSWWRHRDPPLLLPHCPAPCSASQCSHNSSSGGKGTKQTPLPKKTQTKTKKQTNKTTTTPQKTSKTKPNQITNKPSPEKYKQPPPKTKKTTKQKPQTTLKTNKQKKRNTAPQKPHKRNKTRIKQTKTTL